MDNAFKYLKTHDAAYQKDFPYVAKDWHDESAKCHDTPATKARVSKFTDLKEDMDSLLDAIAQQPVAIAVQANQDAFLKHKSGIITGCIGNRLDHGILAVGYGKEGETSYVIIKNSWGLTWGESGYARINSADQACGMTQKASYPTVA
jgi:C1A family cysteine protease